jgi:hypothetical protein
MAHEIDGVWANDSRHEYGVARDTPDIPVSWDVVFQ